MTPASEFCRLKNRFSKAGVVNHVKPVGNTGILRADGGHNHKLLLPLTGTVNYKMAAMEVETCHECLEIPS